jgi:hypothetical protein
VCKAARAGVREKLGTLPGLVVCGGSSGAGRVRDVRKLDLATMRWEPMPALVTARSNHACCAVRGSLVVFGGQTAANHTPTSSVEMLPSGQAAFVELPPLSCGAIYGAVAIPVEESDSALGQVLLLGGFDPTYGPVSTVRLVDLATGVCTPAQVPDLLRPRCGFAAERLPDGRIVCVGSAGVPSPGEVYGPPESGAPDAACSWRQLPAMSVGRRGGSRGCVMSDGRFAVLGGWRPGSFDGLGGAGPTPSCEVLVTSDDNERWEPLPPMHDSRRYFACEFVAGCIIVAGGWGRTSTVVYDEELGRWLRLPNNLPNVFSGLSHMGSALV